MNYDWITYDEIEKTARPNLLAELKESGYSICTVSEHMGHGRYKEDNKIIWDKLLGKEKMLATECLSMMQLFGCKYEYLFSNKLEMLGDIPLAKVRWYQHNKKKAEEIERIRKVDFIRQSVMKSDELLDAVYKMCAIDQKGGTAV